jgi:hypothetical protein
MPVSMNQNELRDRLTQALLQARQPPAAQQPQPVPSYTLGGGQFTPQPGGLQFGGAQSQQPVLSPGTQQLLPGTTIGGSQSQQTQMPALQLLPGTQINGALSQQTQMPAPAPLPSWLQPQSQQPLAAPQPNLLSQPPTSITPPGALPV